MSNPLVDLVVPSMGESVTEATLAKWLKPEGSQVAMDEPLVELETDKVTLEVSAPVAGVLSKILIPQGETVEVGTLIGHIQAGAQASVGSSTTAVPSSASVGSAEQKTVVSSSQEQATVMPAARKMMAENNLVSSDVSGTGKGGRVLKEDVMNALDKTPQQNKVVSDRQEERIPMSRLRQRIAQRLKEAQNTAAILTTFNEVDMSAVMALRERLKAPFEKKHGARLGFMSFFVRACQVALGEIPALNAEIQENEIVYKNYYDMGVAVGTPQGLVVPVVRGTEHMSFADIEKEIARLGEKAKNGKLTIEDLTGGTFTISNGGVYGSLLSTPIINPPQSGILGMHKIQKRPVVVGDQIVIRPMMYVALSYDHRIVDGREAVTFLVRVKESLEDPERLLLDL